MRPIPSMLALSGSVADFQYRFKGRWTHSNRAPIIRRRRRDVLESLFSAAIGMVDVASARYQVLFTDIVMEFFSHDGSFRGRDPRRAR